MSDPSLAGLACGVVARLGGQRTAYLLGVDRQTTVAALQTGEHDPSGRVSDRLRLLAEMVDRSDGRLDGWLMKPNDYLQGRAPAGLIRAVHRDSPLVEAIKSAFAAEFDSKLEITGSRR